MITLKKLVRNIDKIWIKRKPFLAFQIEPTSRCQLSCVMCPRTIFSKEWNNGDMPISLYEEVSKHFHLVENIHLQGWGEPLLHPEINLMIQIAKSAHCKTSLTTNGVLLTEGMSEELVKRGMNSVAVSIAGAKGETHEAIRCGSHFEQIIDNIKTLAHLKLRMRSKIPKIVFSFLMTTMNIKELPEALELAKDAGANEMVATNIDYIPGKIHEDMKIFSCKEVDSRYKTLIESALKIAKKIQLPFRIYPLEMEELIMCEMNPLKIIFLSHDGCVSPCVYLNLSKKGLIPRLFCGNQYEIERKSFGNIEQHSFMEIWESEDYRKFRSLYARRLAINVKAFDYIDGLQSKNAALAGFEKLEAMLRENPLPSVCRSCYKAYNL
jgi:MoaA/NifB/PqqE/SkfB family radical SAM enzyme